MNKILVLLGIVWLFFIVGAIVSVVDARNIEFNNQVKGHFYASCKAPSLQYFAVQLHKAVQGIHNLGIKPSWMVSQLPWEQTYYNSAGRGIDMMTEAANTATRLDKKLNSQEPIGDIHNEILHNLKYNLGCGKSSSSLSLVMGAYQLHMVYMSYLIGTLFPLMAIISFFSFLYLIK